MAGSYRLNAYAADSLPSEERERNWVLDNTLAVGPAGPHRNLERVAISQPVKRLLEFTSD